MAPPAMAAMSLSRSSPKVLACAPALGAAAAEAETKKEHKKISNQFITETVLLGGLFHQQEFINNFNEVTPFCYKLSLDKKPCF